MEAPRIARNTKAHSSWNMGAILEGDRSGFARPGPKERLSRELILKAEEGNYNWIYGILRDNLASPDVADAQGYTVLAAAAVSAPLPLPVHQWFSPFREITLVLTLMAFSWTNM